MEDGFEKITNKYYKFRSVYTKSPISGQIRQTREKAKVTVKTTIQA